MMIWGMWQAIAAIVAVCLTAIGGMYKLFANHLHEVRDQILLLEKRIVIERETDRKVAREDLASLRMEILDLRAVLLQWALRHHKGVDGC